MLLDIWNKACTPRFNIRFWIPGLISLPHTVCHMSWTLDTCLWCWPRLAMFLLCHKSNKMKWSVCCECFHTHFSESQPQSNLKLYLEGHLQRLNDGFKQEFREKMRNILYFKMNTAGIQISISKWQIRLKPLAVGWRLCPFTEQTDLTVTFFWIPTRTSIFGIQSKPIRDWMPELPDLQRLMMPARWRGQS